MEHALIPPAKMHGVVAYEPANDAALAAITPSSSIKYKQACKQDDGSVWMVLPAAGSTWAWAKVRDATISSGPTGTDFGALAIANGLTPVGYFRGDYGLSGSSGSGLASWANIAGGMSAITPDGSATNGIGAATAGLGGRAGLKHNGASQMGQMTAPTLAVPGTTNWHRYWIAKQASGGSGSVRKIVSETGDAYKVELATGLLAYAFGATSNGNNVTLDTWQRGRVSVTGSTSSEIKIGSQAVGTGGSGAVNTAPATARTFGSLLLNWEWLLYMEVTGTKANFLTFAAAADAAAQTTWTNAIEI